MFREIFSISFKPSRATHKVPEAPKAQDVTFEASAADVIKPSKAALQQSAKRTIDAGAKAVDKAKVHDEVRRAAMVGMRMDNAAIGTALRETTASFNTKKEETPQSAEVLAKQAARRARIREARQQKAMIEEYTDFKSPQVRKAFLKTASALMDNLNLLGAVKSSELGNFIKYKNLAETGKNEAVKTNAAATANIIVSGGARRIPAEA